MKQDSKTFISIESLSGLLLIAFAILAMIIKNTGGAGFYNGLLFSVIEIRAESFSIEKPLLLWINDGIMAIFFFVIGLELKKELLVGKLSDTKTLMLPAIAAIGGVAVPAAIYVGINYDNPLSMHGWAIPTATDIAFALAVLSLMGNRVPASLKLFLMTLAIIDDFVGILIIAIFYTESLSLYSLLASSIGFSILFVLNRMGVKQIAPYFLVGLFIWTCFLKSGVHATLAGVLNAFFMPLASHKRTTDKDHSLLEELLHSLHPYVALGVLPLFAFANAGIDISATNLNNLFTGVPLGIFLGLFLGKQIGVFTFSFLAIKSGLCKLPQGANWGQLYGTAIICGIGFTMSLFISSLAFEETNVNLLFDDRLGIILGSILSGVVGYLILKSSLSSKNQSS